MFLPSNNVKVFPIANRSIDGANTLTESNLTFLSRSLSMGSNGFVYDLIDNMNTLDISFSLAGYSFKIIIPKSTLTNNDTNIYAGISISNKGQIQGLDDEADGKYKGLDIYINEYNGEGEYLLIAEKNNVDGNWKIPTSSLLINQLIAGIDGKR